MNLVDIESVWPRIAPSVHALMLPHEVDELFDACREGRTLAFANEDGVLIVTLAVLGGDFELVVLAAVGAGRRLYERYLPFLETVAHDLGAHRIVFQPRRRGWARRLSGCGGGWTLRHDGMFVREI